MPVDASPRTPLVRRLAASAVDGLLVLVLPVLWWHWAEWAQYTTTFGRRWPAAVAFPVMAIMPLTVLWLEAVTGRGAGKGLLGLRVATADGGRAALGRRVARAAIKWSPTWVGPAAYVFGLLVHSTIAADFAGTLGTLANDVGDALPRGDKVAAGLTIWGRGMSVGAVPLAALVLGEVGVLLPGRRSLLDVVTGTRVMKR